MVKQMCRLFPRFRTQMLIYFLLAIIIPILLLTLVLYKGTVVTAQGEVEDALERENSSWFISYQARKQRLEQSAYTITNNPLIRLYFSQLGYSDPDIIKSVNNYFRPMMSWFLSTNSEIERVHFITENRVIPEDGLVSQISRYTEETWFGDILTKAGKGFWKGVEEPFPWIYSKTIAKSVASYQRKVIGKPLTFMQLDVPASYLFQGISFAIDTQSGEIVYSSLFPDMAGSRLSQAGADVTAMLGMHTIKIKGEEYGCLGRSDKDLNLAFISCYAQSEIMPARRQAIINFSILIITLVILIIVLVRFFTQMVTSRVGRIDEMVRKITKGDYKVTYEPKYMDEIEKLGVEVANMGQQMDYLVNQVLIQKLLNQEAEFRALQAQINPHFIFNTLESFCMLAEEEGLTHLSDKIAQLGKLMRYNLRHESMTQLNLELANIRSYVELQNLCHNDRIRLSLMCDLSLHDCCVLRLMLQPIVENAILHGIKANEYLNIDIEIKRSNGRIRISVSNDGKLMSADEKEQLDRLLLASRNKTNDDDGQRIALQNIQRRLLIQYGEDALLHIEQNKMLLMVWFDIPERKES
jgi:two-component system, sensor histidine kinase YesM